MKNNTSKKRVSWYLFSALLAMTVIPFLGSLYLLDRSLDTSLNLAFNSSINNVLTISSENLKSLKNLDPKNEEVYRRQFNEIKELSYIYSAPEQIRNTIFGSLKIYFILGLSLSILFALIIASLLSRKVSDIYQTTFSELIRKKDQLQYLKELSNWQQMAKMLAHEIKNPLTPIKIMTTSLKNSYNNLPSPEFKEFLNKNETMVLEEISHLENVVHRFSEFSNSPKIQLKKENIIPLLKQIVETISKNWADIDIQQIYPTDENFSIPVDSSLLRQALFNIIKNGIEANPGKALHFALEVSIENDRLHINISNNGNPIPPKDVERIFEPSFSTKSGKDNMGLGLSIVKKILIEHHGDIAYDETQVFPRFIIILPLSGDFK